jgi:2-keto-4-pentenoate hydratase/2-oxohepta-3-ene-1,7-dioic acid hydratase in catechol pathway
VATRYTQLMKIVSFGPKRGEKPGLIHGDRIIDLLAADDSIPPTVRGILALGTLDRLEAVRARAGALPSNCLIPLSEARLGPPVTNPSKIICLGLNYKDHAEEQGKKVPDWPMTFAKAPSALVGNGDPIRCPVGVTQLDHEVELAIYIGRRAKDVSLDNASRYIAGYSVFMDISARDIQYREKQFFRAKSFDGFGPAGPCLVTADDIGDPHNLEISLEVNGRRVQSSNTGQMTFKASYLVHYLSNSMTLEAGDIIATGTHAGVGVFADPPRFLDKGDVLEASIESLGTLTNTIV